MRRPILVVATLAVLSVSVLSCRSNKRLLGKWTSEARGKGGVATVAEFRPDGSFVSTYEMILDCSYQFQGGQLVLSMADAKTGRTSADLVETRISGDTLVLKAPWDGTEYEMQRSEVKRPSDVPVVGKWVSGANGAHPATAEFTPNGKLTFRQPLKSASGRYVVSGDSLALDFEGSPPQKGRFRFQGDSLVLTPDGGASQIFKKSRPDD